MPDVVSEIQAGNAGALDWVGMEGIEIAMPWVDPDGHRHLLAARGDAFVNLARAQDRGIHMSRLYRALDAWSVSGTLGAAALRALLEDFLSSHAPISDRSRVALRFELPLRRPALSSGLSGWRLYPVCIAARRDAHGFSCETQIDITYSSTCPGSAALARQLVQHAFDASFPAALPARNDLLAWLGSPSGICATPHAQRSIANVRVRWSDGVADPLDVALIDRLEAALVTPVQAAVKREDEQEFARLNGQSPMYCEDAARRLRVALESHPLVHDYRIRVAHLESLHPHDAVAIAVRGVEGGFSPDAS
jgi:GTP cyclohydrolase IB